ncbi:MAG: NAD(P)/FAD-dependent oxidoreductase [Moraxellaceae bacterium]
MATEHFDVLIVGAGLSGIGAAWHLQNQCKGKTYAILESREAIGGTWDLFRYPGIRSDSDMYTLGYSFKPWTSPKAIADGPSIREYIRSTARDNGIDKHIRYGHKIIKSTWSSEDAVWIVDAERTDTGKAVKFTCNFLFMCTGYYKYEAGFTPHFEGRERFKGQIIHPQLWPENLDYAGKKVVIIGSGATAVTLVPAMTDKAAHVTMLQRSPTYVVSIPEKDPIANSMRRFLPEKLVYRVTRAKNVSLTLGFFNLAKKRPKPIRRLLLAQVRAQVGKDFDMKHFTPSYNPWDERLCAVPDGDLFKVLRKGKASVVTDHIDTFTETGIKLKSGQELEADIIITATGLDLQLLGGMKVFMDGKQVDMSQRMNYKGIMFEGLPNIAMIFGYTNASWTLKADISSEYICRLLNQMDKKGMRQCTPHNTDPTVVPEAFVDMHSGYIQRALAHLPKQGNKAPWKVYMNYMLDLAMLRYRPVEDGIMELSNPGVAGKARVKRAQVSTAEA